MSVDREPWMDLANCASTDPEAFFTESGGTTLPARAVCAECDCVAACLAYSVENRIQFGVFGGLSARERQALWRTRA